MDNTILSTEQKENLLKKTKGKCAHCGKKLTLENMVVCNVYPNNDNSEYNTVALCEKCNADQTKEVYDMGHYDSILSNEVTKYKYKLLESIYNDAEGTNIFGVYPRISYYLPEAYYNKMLKSKKLAKNKDNLLKTLGKKVVFKLLNKDDITEDVLDLIKQDCEITTEDDDDTEVTVEINKEYIFKLMDKSSLYGIFMGDTVLGLVAFTNLKDIKLTQEDFVKAVEDYKEAYVITFNTIRNKYDGLCESIHTMVTEYMTMTGNLVLYSHTDDTLAITNKMKGIPSTLYEAVENVSFIKDEEVARYLVLTLDEAHDSILARTNDFKNKVNAWKDTYEK